ncbi:hypothetical protein, partial [Spirosoma harenae]
VCDRPTGIEFDSKTNARQVELNASWCDVRYAISWTVQHPTYTSQGWVRNTLVFPQGQDRRRVVVDRPEDVSVPTGIPSQPYQQQGVTDVYTVYCVQSGSTLPCSYPLYVDSPLMDAYNNPSHTYTPVGPGTTEPANTPDACNGFINIEKGGIKNFTYNPGDDDTEGSYYVLYTDWCGGSVVWYDGTQKLTNLTVGPYTVSKTFNYECTLPSGQVSIWAAISYWKYPIFQPITFRASLQCELFMLRAVIKKAQLC